MRRRPQGLGRSSNGGNASGCSPIARQTRPRSSLRLGCPPLRKSPIGSSTRGSHHNRGVRGRVSGCISDATAAVCRDAWLIGCEFATARILVPAWPRWPLLHPSLHGSRVLGDDCPHDSDSDRTSPCHLTPHRRHRSPSPWAQDPDQFALIPRVGGQVAHPAQEHGC